MWWSHQRKGRKHYANAQSVIALDGHPIDCPQLRQKAANLLDLYAKARLAPASIHEL
jgi:hypothetical protein